MIVLYGKTKNVLERVLAITGDKTVGFKVKLSSLDGEDYVDLELCQLLEPDNLGSVDHKIPKINILFNEMEAIKILQEAGAEVERVFLKHIKTEFELP